MLLHLLINNKIFTVLIKKKKNALTFADLIGFFFYFFLKYDIIIRKILLSYCLKLRKKRGLSMKRDRKEKFSIRKFSRLLTNAKNA